MEETHKVDRSGVLKVSAGKKTGKRKGSGFSGVRKKRVARQEDQGEYAQDGEQRVRKKGKGLLGKDGLLHYGEAETITAVAELGKVSASSHVGTIEAQSQHWL
ncbi:hypothetical protein O181_089503 [Austropuccinia psidii MF-1]|uniref:Uncharacterized protein n=1 Tax=Austropuccinia psidii MF-1 TaxID=1389203 RepID=A0A9Q3ITD3_9BASI|nr:hypothetical protein [Austropuccinia psidii MF-1]